MRLPSCGAAIALGAIPALLLILVGGACAKSGEKSADTVAGAPGSSTPDTVASATGMGDMKGMEGMKGMDGMMGDMQTQMKSMMDASGKQMKSMLPAHRQMVANMLSQMTGEMRQMNMAADASWTATVDSVRQDLVRMPELNGAELEAMMPAHRTRMTRLGEMHQQMMRSMPK